MSLSKTDTVNLHTPIPEEEDINLEINQLAQERESKVEKPRLTTDDQALLDLEDRLMDVDQGHRTLARMTKLAYGTAKRTYDVAVTNTEQIESLDARMRVMETNILAIALHMGVPEEELTRASRNEK